MKVNRSPAMVNYLDQVMRRKLRLCGWLGLSPASSLDVDDDAPDDHGFVEVSWRSLILEQPTQGKVILVGVTQCEPDPAIHTGTVRLHPGDAAAMLEATGPKPVFPIAASDRAALEGLT